MPFRSRENKGSNSDIHSDPSSESKHRNYKHGHFYDGNKRMGARELLKKEGSMGLHIDQGFIRTSGIPMVDETGEMGQNNKKRLPEQGSHAHFKY